MVGIGPGGPLDRTQRAEDAIKQSSVVVGYRLYLELIADLLKGKKTVFSGMTQEVDRCRIALDEATEGNIVSLISSGDAGVYGMAGLAIELAASQNIKIPIEIVPGISAAHAAASKMGAPLMLDYACISLSDLLVPWETIRQRLEAVAAADLVTALYNPRSKKRISQLDEAAEIFKRYRPLSTPVGIGRAVGTEEEEIIISDLEHFLENNIDMRSVVIIGNQSSAQICDWFITKRGYKV